MRISIIFLAALCCGLHSSVAPAQTTLETRQVALSQSLKPGDRSGRLRFLGMLELPDITHEGVRLSQLSGLDPEDAEGIV